MKDQCQPLANLQSEYLMRPQEMRSQIESKSFIPSQRRLNLFIYSSLSSSSLEEILFLDLLKILLSTLLITI